MSAVSVSHPRCFMHVPKCGGSSVHQALEQALPAGALSPRRRDTSDIPAGFRFDLLDEPIRREVAVGEAEILAMGQSQIVSGHFSLGSLMKIAPPSAVGTVLREPRARLLSLYSFLRLHTAEQRRPRPFGAFEASDAPLQQFLANPTIAPAIDNVVCRMLLHDVGRFAPDEFIPPEAIGDIAQAALDRLDTLGVVAILELPAAMWSELSEFFGVHLKPRRSQVTGVAVKLESSPVEMAVTPEMLEVLELRTAADAVVYEEVLARRGLRPDEISGLRRAAFAEQLIRLGDVAGRSAEQLAACAARLAQREREAESMGAQLAWSTRELAALENRHELLREELARTTGDLERHRAWLEGVQHSVSWRATAPLRGVKQFLKR